RLDPDLHARGDRARQNQAGQPRLPRRFRRGPDVGLRVPALLSADAELALWNGMFLPGAGSGRRGLEDLVDLARDLLIFDALCQRELLDEQTARGLEHLALAERELL